MSVLFLRHGLALATFAFLVAGPVSAQETAPVLRVDAGMVMTSTSGGEFASTAGGDVLQPGNRVMVAEGGRATLVYGNGCTQPLETAGVYTVPGTCNPAPPVARVGSGKLIVGGVAALGLVAALAGGGGGDDSPPPPPPPVSR